MFFAVNININGEKSKQKTGNSIKLVIYSEVNQYSIFSKYNPQAGAAGPQALRLRAKSACATCSTGHFPFPTNRKVPTILRHI
jgi:hypothetical protein